MKQSNIKFIILLGTIAIIGIIIIQIYWLQRAWDINEKKFNHSVHMALNSVATRIFQYNNIQPPAEYPINQLSSNYFVVNTNSEIEPEILEFFLKSEFEANNIATDFEYAIYSCADDKMVYGNYVSLKGAAVKDSSAVNLPKYDEYLYYFGINFPSKKAVVFSNMSLWIIFSSVFIVVIIFFTYALFIILEQKRLSEQQKDFINNMTHEFKTPISSINLSADVLLNPDIIETPERLHTYTKLIKQENKRLNEQVEKVLHIARIERSGFNLKLEEFNAHGFIDKIAKNLIFNKNSSINYSLEAGNQKIKADKIHFTNIIFSILDNAVKYSNENPEIEISTKNSGHFFILCIRDNGIGIAAENQKKVFKKFFRVPTGNIHDVKGFGLGLYYVKTICKLHRWKLKMQSEPGKGTEISIFIPVKK